MFQDQTREAEAALLEEQYIEAGKESMAEHQS